MNEIELSAKKLRLLDCIVHEEEMERAQLSPAEHCGLLSLLRANLVRLHYSNSGTAIEPTDRGKRFISDTDVDSAETVETPL